MQIDMSRFKVIYGEKVLNALSVTEFHYAEGEYPMRGKDKTIFQPWVMSVVALNTDGCIVVICDEAWRFQFIPIVERGV